jgi:hypothetical protein
MKMNVRLGVPTEAMLKHPTACFRLSKAAAHISNSLSFGEFYLVNTKGGALAPRDLEHLSASIYTTSKSANDLALLVDDPELRKDIQAYSRQAAKINKLVRATLPEKKGGPVKAGKAPTLKEMLDKTKVLREKLKEIDKKVEDLCVVKPGSVSAPTAAPKAPEWIQSRIGMAGNTHKKRPMYPRYFVASMGRSRR